MIIFRRHYELIQRPNTQEVLTHCDTRKATYKRAKKSELMRSFHRNEIVFRQIKIRGIV